MPSEQTNAVDPSSRRHYFEISRDKFGEQHVDVLFQMTNKEAAQRTGYVDNVKIIDVEKRYKPGPKHYVSVNKKHVHQLSTLAQVYVMQVTWSSPANVFIVYRRYAQFFDLQAS